MGDNNVEDIVQYIDQQLNGISIVSATLKECSTEIKKEILTDMF